MQLASYGTRALPARYLSRIIPHNSGINLNNAARSIHIGPLPRPSASTAGTAQKVVQQTRNILTRFFAHLTAPGLRAPSTSFPSTARSLHTASRTGIQGIHANLSLPARHALSRGPFLPRAPMVPRTITQVGLGTARNFSSTRPIFQNLAQNVPVAGRAFWEVDWELHGKPHDQWVKIEKENSKKQEKTKEMIKPNKNSSLLFTKPKPAATQLDSELEHYFPHINPVTAGLITYLLIPLAPTPTTRHPLSASPPLRTRNRRDVERLLPIPELAALHTSHTTHALRVSSLFARLDAGNVWDKGVSCDAYSSSTHSYDYGDGDVQGVCTILRVSFAGWSAAEVRSVIGESGTGWCELHEVRSESATPLSLSSSASSDIGSEDDSMSDLSSSDGNEGTGFEMTMDRVDPSQSFVLPTLDFSSSFPASSTSRVALSPTRSFSDMTDNSTYLFSSASSDTSDPGSDSDSSSGSDSEVSSTFSFHDSTSFSEDGSWAQQPSWYGSSRFGFGFSSEFAGRLSSGEDGPREHMF